MRLRWLGAAGVELACESGVVLVDPYLSRLSKARTLLAPLEPDERQIARYLEGVPGDVVAVLCGHTHSDHALDIPAIVRRTRARAYGSESLRNLLAAQGLSDLSVAVEGGRTYEELGIEMRPIVSRHSRIALGLVPFPGVIRQGLRPPLRFHQYRHGTVFAWLVVADGLRVLHLGSADFIEESLQGVEVDVVLPSITGRQQTPGFVRALVDVVRPRVVVPIHFDDFSTPLDEKRLMPRVELPQFVEEVTSFAPRVRVIVPTPLEPIGLDPVRAPT